jgi:hypothetical protein
MISCHQPQCSVLVVMCHPGKAPVPFSFGPFGTTTFQVVPDTNNHSNAQPSPMVVWDETRALSSSCWHKLQALGLWLTSTAGTHSQGRGKSAAVQTGCWHPDPVLSSRFPGTSSSCWLARWGCGITLQHIQRQVCRQRHNPKSVPLRTHQAHQGWCRGQE